MSGTSLDGIDAALVETDGKTVHRFGAWITLPYDDVFRLRLRNLLRGQGDPLTIERELTLHHADAVRAVLKAAGKSPQDIHVIGFHGQTVVHKPAEGITWQIGNGALLAAETGIDVVCDFRRTDVALGGHGAPLVPLFHAALAKDLPKPVAILNIGGVSNVTWIGARNRIMAFDTGPGNALLNDLVHSHTGLAHDHNGALARAGKPDPKLLAHWLADPFFASPPPKSLDRNHFDVTAVYRLSASDAAATLTHFTVRAIQKALTHFPQPPKHWYVCGGGRHNPSLMEALSQHLHNVRPCDDLHWQGDALEAQAFAFLAVRCLKGLPLSLPSTTGVSKPATGGALYRK